MQSIQHICEVAELVQHAKEATDPVQHESEVTEPMKDFTELLKDAESDEVSLQHVDNIGKKLGTGMICLWKKNEEV